MKVQTTPRGFEIVCWNDVNAEVCQLQQSSAIDFNNAKGLSDPGSSFVWLGRQDDRMHLDRGMVKDLIVALQRWLDTGSFENAVPVEENNDVG